MRTLIAVAFACTVGFVGTMALIHYGPRHTGITVAIIAALVLVVELVNAIRRTRRRRGRAAVWARRDSAYSSAFDHCWFDNQEPRRGA
jgi:uncharacterized membrane-anchored protein